MAPISCDSLTKVYPDGTRAVNAVSLEIADGELLVLVGPSGCGKTTLLRMIAGLEEVSEGSIRIGGRIVNRVPARERDIAMVFQSYALYPQMTVYENIGFGLKLHHVPKREIDTAVRATAAMLGLTELLDKRPRQLSGGQRQRVAMGRAIARKPRVFLLDEPLSNLDAKLRVQVRGEIARLQRELAVTTVYVTHDQVEAVTLGHRVAAMRDGVIQQLDKPHVLYEHPANLFVAGFIGSPPMNLFEAAVGDDGPGLSLTAGPHRLEITGEALAGHTALRGYVGKRVVAGIRPESLQDAAYAAGPASARLRVRIDRREQIGAETYLYFPLDGVPVLAADSTIANQNGAPGDAAAVTSQQQSACVARVDARSTASEGTDLELAVDVPAVHYFDLETGEAIRGHEPGRDRVSLTRNAEQDRRSLTDSAVKHK